MKKILSITILLILVFTGTAISQMSQQSTPSQKLYHEWSMTIDIKPEQATHQISMGRHEIKIETIYEPIFSNSKEHLFKLVLNSRVYIDNILLWEGKPGSKVKCTALTGNVVIEIDEKKVWPIN